MKKTLMVVITLAVLAILTSSAGAQVLTTRAPQGSVAKYCTSAPNSTGMTGATDVIGNLRVSTNTTWLMSTNCPGETWGVFLMGETPARLPFGNGFLCISPFETPIYRMGPPEVNDISGISMKHLNFNEYPLPGLTIQPGSTWYFQCCFRDAQAGGRGFNLSSGLAVTFAE